MSLDLSLQSFVYKQAVPFDRNLVGPLGKNELYRIYLIFYETYNKADRKTEVLESLSVRNLMGMVIKQAEKITVSDAWRSYTYRELFPFLFFSLHCHFKIELLSRDIFVEFNLLGNVSTTLRVKVHRILFSVNLVYAFLF